MYGVRVFTVWDWIKKKKLGAINLGKQNKRRRFEEV